LCNSKDLYFNIRKLDSGKYSYPYHFHYNAEELFIILEGSVTLRTTQGLQILSKEDMVFFEMGESSAHQLFNHTPEACIFFDLRTNNGLDVTEYPDSKKIKVGPDFGVFEKGSEVDYFKGEEQVEKIWERLKLKNTSR
jgi:uncharacterized cupin superfamily protein